MGISSFKKSLISIEKLLVLLVTVTNASQVQRLLVVWPAEDPVPLYTDELE